MSSINNEPASHDSTNANANSQIEPAVPIIKMETATVEDLDRIIASASMAETEQRDTE